MHHHDVSYLQLADPNHLYPQLSLLVIELLLPMTLLLHLSPCSSCSSCSFFFSFLLVFVCWHEDARVCGVEAHESRNSVRRLPLGGSFEPTPEKDKGDEHSRRLEEVMGNHVEVDAGYDDGAEGVEEGCRSSESNKNVHVSSSCPQCLVGGDVETAANAELDGSAEEEEKEVLDSERPPQGGVEEEVEGRKMIQRHGDEVGGEREGSRTQEQQAPVFRFSPTDKTRALPLR
mmetsp:Transcript_23722/g.77236  ORF Transcript_23722/g.77236 Transcript_23722/m.77236 type:complete len:231 (+) Transcript_23722:1905-2597(+)